MNIHICNCVSQEQTGNHRLITDIFIYPTNSQWVTNICKAWLWVLAIQKKSQL